MWILLGYSSSKFQHTGSIIHIHWTFLFNFFSKHFSTLLVHIKRKQNLKQEKMWILLKCRLVVPSSTLASDCKYYGTSTFLVIHLYGMSCWIKKSFSMIDFVIICWCIGLRLVGLGASKLFFAQGLRIPKTAPVYIYWMQLIHYYNNYTAPTVSVITTARRVYNFNS